MPEWDVELTHIARGATVVIRAAGDNRTAAEDAATRRAIGFTVIKSTPVTGS